MTDRRERIPADEAKDSKRWNLPYWTEPKHLVHSEEHVEEEVVVEDEEMEVEPLTAEQLETIRQEAFNEGLQQGLVEGRQKGEKLGYDDGFAEGKKLGEEDGRKLGFDAGFEQGEKQAFQNGTAEHEKISKQYQSVLKQIQQELAAQKQELNDSIPDLVLALAKAVITEELSQGSEHIITLVEQALEALPLDSGDLRIDVNPADLPFIEAAIEQGEFDGVAHASENIEAGGCKIHTRYSSVDFTLSERWKTIEKQYSHQMQLAINQSEDDDGSVQPAFDQETESASLLSDPEDNIDEPKHQDVELVDESGDTPTPQNTFEDSHHEVSDPTPNDLSDESLADPNPMDDIPSDHQQEDDHES